MLKQHSSRPFNPSVANAFFRAGEIEAWGRGIQRIFAACREAEAPPPRILHDPGELWLEFPFSAAYLAIIPAGAASRGPGSGGGDRVGKTPGKTLGKTLGKTPGQEPGKTPQAVLTMLQGNPYLTVPEIARQISKSESAIQRCIRNLQVTGRLKRIGSRKSGRWEVQE